MERKLVKNFKQRKKWSFCISEKYFWSEESKRSKMEIIRLVRRLSQ